MQQRILCNKKMEETKLIDNQGSTTNYQKKCKKIW